MWSDWVSRRGRVQKDQDRLPGGASTRAASISCCQQSNSADRLSLQCHVDYCPVHRQRTRSQLLNLPTDYFEEAAVTWNRAMILGAVMIQGWFLKWLPRLITNSPMPGRKPHASEAAALGSILGRYRILMTLASCSLVAVVAIGLVAATPAPCPFATSERNRVMRAIGFPGG